MTRRVRTTKTLAKRMDLMYFSHPHPLRRWRLYLSILIPVLAVLLVHFAASGWSENLQQRPTFRFACCIRQKMRTLSCH